MEAVIYSRVSKLARSISVEDQERECTVVCERNEWPVRAVFRDDGISASRYSKKEREAWVALKTELREGDILVVWEASRAHRDLGEYVALRDLCSSLNVPLSYAGRVLDFTRGDDRFLGGIDALVAERESELIKERALRGKRSGAAAGRPSGRPPWGYCRRRTDDGEYISGQWDHDPVEAPRVREVITRFLDGESQHSLMKWLRETEGWTPSSMTGLQRAIANPALAGHRVHRGEIVSVGKWKAIITDTQHRQVVARIKAIKRGYNYLSQPGPEPKYLLSGIAKCGIEECGASLEHKNFPRRSPAYVCPHGHCCRSAAPMDKMVMDEVFRILSHVNPDDHRDPNPAAELAEKQIADIEEELEGWLDKAERREVSSIAFARVEKSLTAQINALRPKTLGPIRRTPVAVGQLKARWPGLSMRERRDIVRALVNVTVKPFARITPAVCAVDDCGRTKIYARGLCKGCYLKAWRGKIPMPPLLEPEVGRVIVEQV